MSCRGRRSGRCQQDVLLLLRCRSHELLRGGQRGAAHLLSLRLLLLVVVVLLLVLLLPLQFQIHLGGSLPRQHLLAGCLLLLWQVLLPHPRFVLLSAWGYTWRGAQQA